MAASPSSGRPLRTGLIIQELHSLLDGCLQNLNAALDGLGRTSKEGSNAPPDVAARLSAAAEALGHMNRVLTLAKSEQSLGLDLFHDERTLGTVVAQHVQMLQPTIEQLGVRVQVEMTPKASSLRSGLLGPVILQGLRAAIAACGAADPDARRVEVSMALTGDDDLVILIVDSGRGAPVTPQLDDGQSELPQLIIERLGGEMRWASVPFGQGAILQVTVPSRAIEHDG